SQPGPICYGRGGARVTVTDAHVLLGRIDPSAIAGAAATELADVRAAMVEQVGRPPGLDADRAAAAVLAVVGHQLAGAIRLTPAAGGRRSAERCRARFDIELPGVGVTLINLRTAVIGRRRPLDLGRLAAGDGAAGGEAVPGPVGPGSSTPATRRIHFDGGWLD